MQSELENINRAMDAMKADLDFVKRAIVGTDEKPGLAGQIRQIQEWRGIVTKVLWFIGGSLASILFMIVGEFVKAKLGLAR